MKISLIIFVLPELQDELPDNTGPMSKPQRSYRAPVNYRKIVIYWLIHFVYNICNVTYSEHERVHLIENVLLTQLSSLFRNVQHHIQKCLPFD